MSSSDWSSDWCSSDRDDVVRAPGAQLAGLLGARLAAAADEVVVGDGLGADEAALEVGVDDAGGLRRPAVALHGPGARLLWAAGDRGVEGEELLAGTGEAGAGGVTGRGNGPIPRPKLQSHLPPLV